MADVPTTTSPSGDILIVEDDENLRLALQDNLEAEGYQVEVAGTGEARPGSGCHGPHSI